MYSVLRLNAAIITGLVSTLTGVLVMIAALFHISLFQAVFQQSVLMEFNTALAFVLLGSALLLTKFQINSYHTAGIFAASFLITLIGSLSVLQDLFRFNLGIDQLFITDHFSVARKLPDPGRMSINTAVCFILLGLAFLGLNTKNLYIQIVSQYFINLVTAVSALAIIGYLYGLPLFYNLNSVRPMTISSAILFFTLSLIISLLHPEIGITRLFTGKLIGNIMARRLFTLALFIIVLFGAFRLVTVRFELFSLQAGMAILIISFLAVGVAVLWHMVKRLNNLDISRQKAEKEVKGMNAELEKRVTQRSAKLLALLAKLRESEAKFRTAFQHSAIGMALVSLKGKWLKVNKSMCDMVGYKERELLTMSFHDLTHHDDNKLHIDVMEKALNGKQEPFRIEKRYICSNGSVVWVSINIATVLDNNGSALYFVGQFENITDRKEAEKNLKAAYKQIQNHINQIQDMNWKQSHVIRSPVANLKGLATLLQLQPSDNETLEYIHRELDRLDKVIIEMADEASNQGIVQFSAKKRSFKFAI